MIKGSETALDTLGRSMAGRGYEKNDHGLNAFHLELLKHVAAGLCNDEIKEEMKTTVTWVVSAKSCIAKTLKAKNQVHMIAMCYQKGILKVNTN